MKANFLFVDLTPNTNVQEKTPECTYHGWCFRKQGASEIFKVSELMCFHITCIEPLYTPLVGIPPRWA